MTKQHDQDKQHDQAKQHDQDKRNPAQQTGGEWAAQQKQATRKQNMAPDQARQKDGERSELPRQPSGGRGNPPPESGS